MNDIFGKDYVKELKDKLKEKAEASDKLAAEYRGMAYAYRDCLEKLNDTMKSITGEVEEFFTKTIKTAKEAEKNAVKPDNNISN